MTGKTTNAETDCGCRMQKELILEKMKERGCRITKQRLELLDIILENDCASCKDIYYRASKQDPKIGTATVYRMVNILEEIGAIDRKNMYRVTEPEKHSLNEACTIELDDHSVHHLSSQKWNLVLQTGLRACGYLTDQNVYSITLGNGGMEKK
ncbi:transcriptional repressor [bacterium 210820-DFI.6.37]|nr:transcriptional repressor [bacterium 210820-DFI.6.37]